MRNDVLLYKEMEQAKRDMEYAFSRWSMSDELHEEERWLAYQDATERYETLATEFKRRQESSKVVRLPWVAS